MSLYALIMAGGFGSRLWPRSRKTLPKQFINIVGDKTMLQEAYDRIAPLLSSDRVICATNIEYTSIVEEQLPEIPKENILGEPAMRGTASAIGYAAMHIQRRDPDAMMIVLTADHLISNIQEFHRSLFLAQDVASDNRLVTLGITPNSPDTAYGYIQKGNRLPGFSSNNVYEVARFAEKPDADTAEMYIKSGEYTWNSGMFVWKVECILKEINHFLPGLYSGLQKIMGTLHTSTFNKTLAETWNTFDKETIDYGIMEKAKRIAVIPVDIGWNDIGSWTSVYELIPKDSNNNAVLCNHMALNATSNLFYSKNKFIAAIGVEDMIVVDTDDVLLICPKSRSQDVKILVDQLDKCKTDFL